MANSFGDVLRGMGSVLNPQVNQQVMQEQAAEKTQAQALQQMMLQKMMSGVESGAIDPARLPPGLQGMVAPSLQAQAQQQTIANEKGYREAVAQFTPETPNATRAQVAQQYGKPELAMAYIKQDEDRAARLQTAAQAAQDRKDKLDQDFKLGMERITDARARAAFEEQYKTQSLALQGQVASANEAMRRMGLNIQQQGNEIRLQSIGIEREKAATARSQQTVKQVAQLGAALEKANLPEIDAVLGKVEEIMKTPELAAYVTGPQSKIPDLMVSKEAVQARQAFAQLFNITLKNRSGAAVTNQELERLKQEFGSGVFKDPANLISAVERARTIINNHYASVAAGFGPDAMRAYNENAREMGARVVLGEKVGAPKPAGVDRSNPLLRN